MNISTTNFKSMIAGLCVASVGLLGCDAEHESELSVARASVGFGDASLAIEAAMQTTTRIESPLVAHAAAQPANLDIQADATPLEGKKKKKKLEKVKAKDLRGWVRWIGALPYYAGPIFDQTGEQCGEGQSGSTWFLAGTSGGPATRECDVPEGKHLVFPLVNTWCAIPNEAFPTQADVDAFIASREDFSDFVHDHTCELTLRLDGVDLRSGVENFEDLYLEVFDPFDVELVDSADNYAEYFGLVGGIVPTIGSGHYARLAPLPEGDHVLEFGGVLCDGEDVLFETHATYQLHVDD